MKAIYSETYLKWFKRMRDQRAKARILVRVDRLIAGNPGLVRDVGNGISELKITYGKGYRVYYKQQGNKIVIILAGGDKSTQQVDIKMAKKLFEDFK